MKTITEVKAMSLLEAQRLVVDLRTNVPATDKFYPVAIQLINTATGRKDWKEPETIEVKNIAGHSVTIDKITIPADGTGKVYPWQYIAGARFFEAVEKSDHDSAVKMHVRKAAATEDQSLDERIAAAIATALKAAGIGVAKAAALLLFVLFASCLAPRASAQESGQSFIVGPYPSQYNVVLLNTGTNSWLASAGAVAFTNLVTNTVSILTNTVATIVNGSETFTTNTLTNVVASVPGVVFVGNYDKVCLSIGFQAQSAGPNNLTATWDYSVDGTNWQLNAIQEVAVTNAILNPVGYTYMCATNLMLGPGFGPGFIRLNNLALSGSTGWGTNIFAEVAKKPNNTGP